MSRLPPERRYYSVPNMTGGYDVYVTTGQPVQPRFPPAKGLGRLVGIGIRDALPELPAGARLLGERQEPVGSVARLPERANHSWLWAATALGLLVWALR